MIIRAKYAYLANQRIAENVAVTIDRGAIREIESARSAAGDVLDLGDALLLPGLVNAHTHLELGFAAGKVAPGPDFADWLRRLVKQIRSATPDDLAGAIRLGLSESLAAGVTTLGDIARRPADTRATIAGVGVRPTVISFGEVIAYGTLRGVAANRINEALDVRHASSSLRIGISPHAPYTVEPAIIRRCANAARRRHLPMCIHAAETREELRYAQHLDGPLRDFSIEMGVWDDDVPPIEGSPIALLDRCEALDQQTLLAHCNYVTDDDIAIIRDHGAHIAYCPRTHAGFGHPRHPLPRLLKAGINVCLGTDSLASNPDLSILSELRYAAGQFPDIPPAALIDMATINGARALGAGCVDSGISTGAIQPGRRADLIAIPVKTADPGRVLDAVVNGDATACFCCVGGQTAAQTTRQIALGSEHPGDYSSPPVS